MNKFLFSCNFSWEDSIDVFFDELMSFFLSETTFMFFDDSWSRDWSNSFNFFLLIDGMSEFLMLVLNFFDSKDSRFFAVKTNKIDEDFESEFELIIWFIDNNIFKMTYQNHFSRQFKNKLLIFHDFDHSKKSSWRVYLRWLLMCYRSNDKK
jgi:hypothetical protein